ncbi:MAG: alpha/beta hydrolase [Defluviicoccus sp.]|nr:alpha/beta hydrolase [Defluviicoccus sp.]MDE0274403.1 alpha/beta hydrolase [Defluviicoccus sp.]
MTEIASKYVDVDGIRTHYLEAGEGPVVVLLHSGEYGGAAEISWQFTVPALASEFRVVAPDWLGFGRTDKVFDFGDARSRVYRHMQRFVEVMGIGEADFIGNSMGGSNLARIAATEPDLLPLRSIVLCSGGGFTPETEERKVLLAYDGSEDAMRALVKAMLHDPKWGDDDAHVARRQEFATMKGAWECQSAPRLRPPAAEKAGSGFGTPDNTPYENISVPTLIVAGANDPLREPDYAPGLAARIDGAEVDVYENCGHCPNIEHADRFNAQVLDFLRRVNAG